MRISKTITFSVPPEMEEQIQKHAQSEHRTVSEYMREAVRQYMKLSSRPGSVKESPKKDRTTRSPIGRPALDSLIEMRGN